MEWVLPYGLALTLIAWKARHILTFRQWCVLAAISALWAITLIIQITIPGRMPEWAFGILHFLAGVLLLVTAQKNKWQYVVTSWYIPMMVTHIVFSIVKPEVIGVVTLEQYKAFFSYFVISNILTWAQLLTFGIWLIADHGHIRINWVSRYSGSSLRLSRGSSRKQSS